VKNLLQRAQHDSMTCKQTSNIKLATAAMLERAPKAKSNFGKIWNPFFLSSALWWRGFHGKMVGVVYHLFLLS
jgi:hypothetical protein